MKLYFFISIVLLGFSLVGCEEEDDLFRDFVIRQGDHYATPHIVQSLQSNVLKFEAKFNFSARYHFQEEGLQDSKNKLLGFSDCNSLHHQNSARFAWQWFNDQLEIYAYCYVNGQRVERFIGLVPINEVNHYELHITKHNYIFILNHNERVEIERGAACNAGIYYMLWPYFGGRLPAPHDINIQLRIGA